MAHLGFILSPFWAILGSCWAPCKNDICVAFARWTALPQHGPSWLHLKPTLGDLGFMLSPVHKRRLRRPSCLHLRVHLGQSWAHSGPRAKKRRPRRECTL
eukprot:6915065-Karenia_brevis.AAC.1